MSKEKQIEEMARVLCEDFGEKCKTCPYEYATDLSVCIVKEECEDLYNAGYRKASEVAEEVFEWLEEKGLLNIEVWAIQDVKAELKKKYESEKDNG